MFWKIWTVFLARSREFYRDKGGLAWNLIFPALLIFGFAFAFSRDDRPTYKVGVFPGNAISDSSNYTFLTLKYIDFIPVLDTAHALSKVKRHQLDMLINVNTPMRSWINEQSSKGYLVEKIIKSEYEGILAPQNITGRKITYADWLIPGILAMNMMFSALWGVGWVIVRYRKSGYLKRLKATPLRTYEFIIGQVLSRLAVIVGSTTFVFVGSWLILRFPMNGSFLLLILVYIVGAFSMISLGLIFASRFTNEEMVSGLLNFISWPMMFLSGVWFSLEGLHPWLQKCSYIFPLTHIINASRAIIIDGAGFKEVSSPLAALAVVGVLFVVIGSLLFKWE